MFFFFNDTATTKIYTLSLHDALPICHALDECGCDLPTSGRPRVQHDPACARTPPLPLRVRPMFDRGRSSVGQRFLDRKSTRLNSSHANISYAVFCLKKKHLLFESTTI